MKRDRVAVTCVACGDIIEVPRSDADLRKVCTKKACLIAWKKSGPGMLDAGPARNRLRRLRRAGASYPALIAATGLTKRALILLIKSPEDGGNRFIRPATHDTIMALKRVRCLDNQLIPAGPTLALQERLLKVMSGSRMERETGYRRVEADRQRVSVKLARAYREVADFYLDDGKPSAFVALDPDALRAAPVRPLDDATRRAFDRIVSGQERVRLHVAQRVCEESGIELEEAIA